MRYFLFLLHLLPFLSSAQENPTKKNINVICLVSKGYDETMEFYSKKLAFEISMDRKFGENQR